jgi:hypothetical protein
MAQNTTASLSFDLDNQWSYMKTHGDAGWESYPSYLDVLIPLALDVLEEHSLKITFFVVGRDAALEKNRDAFRLLANSGHEVGNHSFDHDPWMCERSREEIRRELVEAGDAIQNATGQQARGFRGPGFCWSAVLLELLAAEGYVYDASTFPTYIGPLARLYYFRRSSLTERETQQRRELFGTFGEGRRSLKPYLWDLEAGRTLLEIPVSTIPVIKTPFHLSYLIYLSRYSERLMSAYLQTALQMCRWTGTEPSFLLHPLDLLGAEQVPELQFFPGMDLSGEHKRRVFDRVLRELANKFTLVKLSEHADRLLRREPPLRRIAA